MIAGMPSSATSASASPSRSSESWYWPGIDANLAPEVFAVIDEQRVDQIIDGQLGFANQVAKPGMAAEPAWPMQGITGGGFDCHRAIPGF